jgi:Tripartite tricarboxylate transporter TctB family
MSSDRRVRNYWREEFALIAALLLLFGGVITLSIRLPFDARLFPLVIGTAGILLCLAIAWQEKRRRHSAEPAVHANDPATNVSWRRFATALLAAPAFGVVFWLFGFFIASLAAMLLMPALMGYTNRRLMLLVGVATVAMLAVFFPYLVGINLPHGLVGDWLIDMLRSH